MKRRAIELLPGPCVVVNNCAVFVRPADGLRLSEQLARLSFRKSLEQEADAFAARSNKRKVGKNGRR
jgi:hypothetical protein